MGEKGILYNCYILMYGWPHIVGKESEGEEDLVLRIYAIKKPLKLFYRRDTTNMIL